MDSNQSALKRQNCLDTQHIRAFSPNLGEFTAICRHVSGRYPFEESFKREDALI